MELVDHAAIIFDSDGVLVDSEAIHIAVERALLAELGLVYEEDVYISRFVGLADRDFYTALEMDYLKLKRGPFPTDFGEKLQEAIWSRVEKELQPLPGVADVIEAFEGRVAVASSAPTERLMAKLDLTDLAQLIVPHIYSADLVEHGEPAPDLFLLAAERLEVAARERMVIEDSIHGIEAAVAAGMTAIGFTGGSHADDKLGRRLKDRGARHVVSSHADLLRLLQRERADGRRG